MATDAHWHAISIDDVEKTLITDVDNGLSKVEAQARLERYGPNVLVTEKKASPLRILLKQFSNILILILIVATALSAMMDELIDAIVILVIIVFVVVLGFLQEYRAERTLDALKRMLSQTCTVRREGSDSELSVSELVPGDLVALKAGDKVPADMRVTIAVDLRLDEASLTGESVPVVKTLDVLSRDMQVADRTNMVFTGTTIVHGRGRALVVATGMNTEFGKIAEALKSVVSEKTPLERRMSEIGRTISVLVLAIIVIVVSVELVEEYFIYGHIDPALIVKVLLFGIALAVAAVPEALPAVVTANLALGMRMMAKNNALIRKMHAVETLGCTQIICSDKTGTLTKGEMTIRRAYLGGSYFDVSGAGYELRGDVSIDGMPLDDGSRLSCVRLAIAAARCNDARLEEVNDKVVVRGDPTEGALIVFAEKLGLRRNEMNDAYRRISEVPFSSERKLMTVIDSTPENTLLVSMKGAPEMVLRCCTRTYASGSEIELSETEAKQIVQANDEMAARGLRVLAIADKRLPQTTSLANMASVEKDFTFLGLVGMIDPPRPEVKEAIQVVHSVGMKTIMITGDHKLTAMAIAKELGINDPDDMALTGEELERIGEKEFERIVEKVTVYARVSPSHKLRIVKAWQKKGCVVAMTGDGVNDAPALKSADIGISMGITGTDVTKEASDMVLADDNFATIVKAVEKGRWIYDNIKKYLAFLLQANLAEIAVLTICALFVLRLAGFEGDEILPLLPVHILYINLATDGLPAIALSFSPPDPDLMQRPPRKKNESVFTKDVKLFLVRALLVETPILIFAFVSALPEGIDSARTRLFLTFVFVELAMALNCRSLRFTLARARPHKWLLLAVAWEALLIVIILAIAPARAALHLTLPTLDDVAWIVVGMSATFIVVEAMKRYVVLDSEMSDSGRGNCIRDS
ncbi:MAG: cation-translocating P-type ATPase [Candidatus Thermoplasmatota archaeon]|nr:cation-translocating P-type ATPase [Candidatus Thermoplasmatota archaeon]